jgi:hypothetical protein
MKISKLKEMIKEEYNKNVVWLAEQELKKLIDKIRLNTKYDKVQSKAIVYRAFKNLEE